MLGVSVSLESVTPELGDVKETPCVHKRQTQ